MGARCVSVGLSVDRNGDLQRKRRFRVREKIREVDRVLRRRLAVEVIAHRLTDGRGDFQIGAADRKRTGSDWGEFSTDESRDPGKERKDGKSSPAERNRHHGGTHQWTRMPTDERKEPTGTDQKRPYPIDQPSTPLFARASGGRCSVSATSEFPMVQASRRQTPTRPPRHGRGVQPRRSVGSGSASGMCSAPAVVDAAGTPRFDLRPPSP